MELCSFNKGIVSCEELAVASLWCGANLRYTCGTSDGSAPITGLGLQVTGPGLAGDKAWTHR